MLAPKMYPTAIKIDDFKNGYKQRARVAQLVRAMVL
jgi:hypothetical protein